jgi:hypothetical protein
MSQLIDAQTFARRRQERMLRDENERGVVERTNRARYARSGAGYRFIPAGGSLFEIRDETVRVA